MKMLLMRPGKPAANGAPRRWPIVRTRGRKYGPVLEEENLSVRRDLVISGPNASGKSRWLAKLDAKAAEIWPTRQKMHIRATEPLQRWYEDPRVVAAMEAKGKTWTKLKAYERVDALVDWFKANRVVLILDDAHKLAGRKLDIAIQLCRAASQLVVGTFAENSIPMSLRMLIDARNPQRISLKSDAAYDVTSLGIWMLILIALGAGWWQLAAILGGMKVLGGGRRAARQT